MNTYTCAHCGGTFTSEWSEEDANAEALENWKVPDASHRPDMAAICEDCYQAFMAWLTSRPYVG
jgi:hypothetical protein